MSESFNLAALAALPIEHDLNSNDPNEIRIGFQGKVSDEVRQKVYTMRREAQRKAATPRCVKALNHIHDHLVGLAQDIACEMESTVG